MKLHSETLTSHEKSMTNMYIYEYEGILSDKITYRRNLVNAIKEKCSGTFDEFDANTMKDEKFIIFIEKAKEAGVVIYRLIKM